MMVVGGGGEEDEAADQVLLRGGGFGTRVGLPTSFVYTRMYIITLATMGRKRAKPTPLKNYETDLSQR